MENGINMVTETRRIVKWQSVLDKGSRVGEPNSSENVTFEFETLITNEQAAAALNRTEIGTNEVGLSDID